MNENRKAALLLLSACVVLATGCGEWNKYWRASPVRPESAADTQPPVVRVISPAGADSAHATPVSGGAVTIVVSAEDEGGVATVGVHVDDAAPVTVTASPWQTSWNTTSLAEGSIHRIWATAVDRSGNTAASAPVYAQSFNAGPALRVSAPVEGERIRGTLPVTVEFEGAVSEIDRVEFLCDATLLGVVGQAPWALSVDTHALTPGEHFITARATTRLGHVGVSPARRVLVNNELPQVSVDFPEDGRRIAIRGTVILSCTARDTVDGAMSGSDIVWRSSLDGPIGSGGYRRFAGLSVGTHTISANATNGWGQTGTASIRVEVVDRPTYSFCGVLYPQILYGWCGSCHSPGTEEYSLSQLDLGSYATLMAGGITRRYETIVPCRPESSLVWNKITSTTPWVGEAMPLRNRALPPVLLEKIRTWILEGAPPDEPETCSGP